MPGADRPETDSGCRHLAQEPRQADALPSAMLPERGSQVSVHVDRHHDPPSVRRPRLLLHACRACRAPPAFAVPRGPVLRPSTRRRGSGTARLAVPESLVEPIVPRRRAHARRPLSATPPKHLARLAGSYRSHTVSVNPRSPASRRFLRSHFLANRGAGLSTLPMVAFRCRCFWRKPLECSGFSVVRVRIEAKPWGANLRPEGCGQQIAFRNLSKVNVTVIVAHARKEGDDTEWGAFGVWDGGHWHIPSRFDGGGRDAIFALIEAWEKWVLAQPRDWYLGRRARFLAVEDGTPKQSSEEQ